MRLHSFILLACLCLSLLLAGTAARGDTDLYTGVVPVSGQGEAERTAMLPEALLHVLRKLSGQRDISPGPALDAAMSRAGELLIAFGYSEAILPQPDGTKERSLRLEARFSPPAMDALLRDLGLQRWRVEREPVVLWVVVDDGRGRTLMPVEYAYEYERMEAVAERRGLPVAWPGLSEELTEQIDVQLLWGGYTEQLVGEGSATEGVAVVAARREGPEWNVRWSYADGTMNSSWRSRAPDLEQALTSGAEELADRVAAINAIGPAGQGEFDAALRITGLAGASDYARCLTYLRGLSLVDGVDVLGIGPAGLRLQLVLNAEPAYLEDILRRDGVLEAGQVDGDWRLVSGRS